MCARCVLIWEWSQGSTQGQAVLTLYVAGNSRWSTWILRVCRPQIESDNNLTSVSAVMYLDCFGAHCMRVACEFMLVLTAFRNHRRESGVVVDRSPFTIVSAPTVGAGLAQN